MENRHAIPTSHYQYRGPEALVTARSNKLDDLIQITISGLSQGAIYGLVALGLTVVYRSTTVLNFAHGKPLCWARS